MGVAGQGGGLARPVAVAVAVAEAEAEAEAVALAGPLRDIGMAVSVPRQMRLSGGSGELRGRRGNTLDFQSLRESCSNGGPKSEIDFVGMEVGLSGQKGQNC
jgi:hypothetical protein